MKDIIQYIFESLDKIAPRTEWLREHYDKYNKELFEGELPSSKNVYITAYRHKTKELGCQGFQKRFYVSSEHMRNGMYEMWIPKPGKYIGIRGGWKNGRQYHEYILNNETSMPVKSILDLDPYISINTSYVFTETELEETLIHEMIHLWVSKDCLEPKQAHGKEFKQKCNEIRKLAKEKYDIEYPLTTTANNHDGYKESDKDAEETKKIIEKNKKRGGGIVGVFIICNEEIKKTKIKCDKRFFFCTKRVLSKIMEDVYYYNKGCIDHIYVSEDSYEKMCNEYGLFSTVTTYKFWDANNYKKSMEIMTKNAEDIFGKGIFAENLNEDKKPYIKPQIFMYEIPENTDLSNINIEDIINSLNQSIDDEIKGSSKNDKKIIDPK